MAQQQYDSHCRVLPMSWRFLQLTKGQSAIVPAGRYEWLMQWKWRAHWDYHTKSFYAVRNEKRGKDGKKYHVKLHRELLGLRRGDGMIGDHINGDTLDYRTENLRATTIQQSNQNRSKPKNNTSGYKGVRQIKRTSRWAVFIQVDGVRVYKGSYVTKEEAVAVCKQLEVEYYGEYARTA